MVPTLTNQQLLDLTQKAITVRQLIIKMLHEAGSGHPGGALGMTDVFVTLYFNLLNHDPKKPLWEGRDRLILSNGHICPVQYACLALSGYFEIDKLATLRKLGTALQGHPKRGALPGIETTSGPLGEGLSQAIGFSLAAKMDNKSYYTFCITSDGEHQEGNTWEAIMFAGKNKLSNLINIVDKNNIQIDGNTAEIMPIDPLRLKYEAFNWHVLEINGNDINEVYNAILNAKEVKNAPVAIIANTVPGKGVDFMENNYLWHGKAPNDAEAKSALQQLSLTAK
jgi:transketolase